MRRPLCPKAVEREDTDLTVRFRVATASETTATGSRAPAAPDVREMTSACPSARSHVSYSTDGKTKSAHVKYMGP